MSFFMLFSPITTPPYHRPDALLGPARLQVLGVHHELQQGGHSQGRIGFGSLSDDFKLPLQASRGWVQRDDTFMDAFQNQKYKT